MWHFWKCRAHGSRISWLFPEPLGQDCMCGREVRWRVGEVSLSSWAARARGLVKRTWDHATNGTTEAQTPGYTAVTGAPPASTWSLNLTCDEERLSMSIRGCVPSLRPSAALETQKTSDKPHHFIRYSKTHPHRCNEDDEISPAPSHSCWVVSFYFMYHQLLDIPHIQSRLKLLAPEELSPKSWAVFSIFIKFHIINHSWPHFVTLWNVK